MWNWLEGFFLQIIAIWNNYIMQNASTPNMLAGHYFFFYLSSHNCKEDALSHKTDNILPEQRKFSLKGILLVDCVITSITWETDHEINEESGTWPVPKFRPWVEICVRQLPVLQCPHVQPQQLITLLPCWLSTRSTQMFLFIYSKSSCSGPIGQGYSPQVTIEGTSKDLSTLWIVKVMIMSTLQEGCHCGHPLVSVIPLGTATLPSELNTKHYLLYLFITISTIPLGRIIVLPMLTCCLRFDYSLHLLCVLYLCLWINHYWSSASVWVFFSHCDSLLHESGITVSSEKQIAYWRAKKMWSNKCDL